MKSFTLPIKEEPGTRKGGEILAEDYSYERQWVEIKPEASLMYKVQERKRGAGTTMVEGRKGACYFPKSDMVEGEETALRGGLGGKTSLGCLHNRIRCGQEGSKSEVSLQFRAEDCKGKFYLSQKDVEHRSGL